MCQRQNLRLWRLVRRVPGRLHAAYGARYCHATWMRLSGTAEPKTASYAEPGPRRAVSSWVGKDQNTIFVLYGDADREAAALENQMHGGTRYAHDNLWGWDIAAKAWTHRRLVGNIPSPRTEMSCAYNVALYKVLAFGGYAPAAPSHFVPAEKRLSIYSYYGDTFMYGTDTNTGAPAWKHVLKRGFPMYRAQAQLAADPATGRTFLFGGYVNAEYVPSRSENESRCFGDLWELRLNIPGGHFADVDVEDEARTARVGPWQRCFACGSVGPWKKDLVLTVVSVQLNDGDLRFPGYFFDKYIVLCVDLHLLTYSAM
ncbi:hypothetical protein C8R44DRAFT_613194 [Mycena epipterygia]|nr:hypothetical protein C8R44DRAFT_613194 [Mycena epipterygia]